jgi:hypothetical protein
MSAQTALPMTAMACICQGPAGSLRSFPAPSFCEALTCHG